MSKKAIVVGPEISEELIMGLLSTSSTFDACGLASLSLYIYGSGLVRAKEELAWLGGNV